MPKPEVTEAQVGEAYALVGDILRRLEAWSGLFEFKLSPRSRDWSGYRRSCAEAIPEILDWSEQLVIDSPIDELLRLANGVYPPGSPGVRFFLPRTSVLEGIREDVWLPLALATHPKIAMQLWGERFAPEPVGIYRDARQQVSAVDRERSSRAAWLAMSREEVVSANGFLLSIGKLDSRELLTIAANREFHAVVAQVANDADALAIHNDAEASTPLTQAQAKILHAMAQFDARRLLPVTAIVEALPHESPLSDKTVRACLRKLIDCGLAERPEGERSGARLTMAGFRLAAKMTD